MKPKLQQNERIDLRVSTDLKSLLTRAAAYSGMPLSVFLVSVASVRAKELVAERETLTLSAEDWKHFMLAIDNTDKQRPKLEAAARRYLKKKDQSIRRAS